MVKHSEVLHPRRTNDRFFVRPYSNYLNLHTHIFQQLKDEGVTSKLFGFQFGAL